MGEIADMILEGILDEQTGEYLGEAVGYPKTLEKGYYNTIKRPKIKYIKDQPWEANIRKVRKELVSLIKKFQSEGKPNPVNNARKYINLKYGKGWRERGCCSNSDDQWLPLSEYKEPENFKFSF